jgi:hypothetical protein
MFASFTSGIELRVGFFVDAPLHSQMMPDIEWWYDPLAHGINRDAQSVRS